MKKRKKKNYDMKIAVRMTYCLSFWLYGRIL